MYLPTKCIDGVCIKTTPEVDNYLFDLDTVRRHFFCVKIIRDFQTENGDKPISELYCVKVRKSVAVEIKVTCANISATEILAMECEEVEAVVTKPRPGKFTSRATVLGGVLVPLELIYYSTHGITSFQTLWNWLRAWLSVM